MVNRIKSKKDKKPRKKPSKKMLEILRKGREKMCFNLLKKRSGKKTRKTKNNITNEMRTLKLYETRYDKERDPKRKSALKRIIERQKKRIVL